jgi:diguanylate cyclase (GGDEF)-like protein
MKTDQRFIVILIGLMAALLIANLVNVGYNFRTSSVEASTDKAIEIANVVKAGLTAHMLNGMMDRRHEFLNRIAHQGSIRRLWLIRSKAVTDQYGKGETQESPRDDLDRLTLSTGEVQQRIVKDGHQVLMRISVPYVASVEETSPNCLKCHHVKPGTVLGAVSMTMDIDGMRNAEQNTLLKIFLINIIFIIIGLAITHYFFRPYMRFFESLKRGINEAYKGNFGFRFPKTLKGDGEELTEHLNDLYAKMDDTFGRIQDDLGTFLVHKTFASDDPLRQAQIIIRELSEIYKFKRTIELDATKEAIYDRIITILERSFGITKFTLYELHKKHRSRTLIYTTLEEDHCTLGDDMTDECRANRTDTLVNAADFQNICPYCPTDRYLYLCLPVNINDEIALTLTVYAEDKKELEKYHRHITGIQNYFETARPAIESRILTSQLRENSMRDGMTGLYNRRFLEEFIDKVMSQTLREEKRYYLLMLDIDYFKLVNDTYGHDAGDIVIKRLAYLIEDNIRASDLAIRYGGEEFLIMLHNASEEGAMKVARNIQTIFNREVFKLNGDTVSKTISIGIAAFPKDSDAIWKVIKYADIALYEAKNAGRNKIVRYTHEMFDYEENRRTRDQKT